MRKSLIETSLPTPIFYVSLSIRCIHLGYAGVELSLPAPSKFCFANTFINYEFDAKLVTTCLLPSLVYPKPTKTQFAYIASGSHDTVSVMIGQVFGRRGFSSV